ncbi:MAG: NUDIX domain-containing protein [Rhodocyclales bacterium]|nr:NUDIX domain-containing protein [Rhodocyclales bacterium]
MWLITPIGFFSVVQKPNDKGKDTLTVRARVRSDLEALRDKYIHTLGDIKESLTNDYRFRAIAPRADVASAIASMVIDLDYSNFKSEVAKRQGGQRETLYHDVWHVLYQLQTERYETTKPSTPSTAITKKPNGQWTIPNANAYGGVLISPDRKVLVREPKGHFGGYVWTWPKGTPDDGETPAQTALREVLEETGVRGRIVGVLPVAYRGSGESTSAFYLMVAEGESGKFKKSETVQIRWVSFAEAAELFKLNHHPEGRSRDRKILDDAYVLLNQISSK